MTKLVFLLKRRPDLSMDEFIAYYETHHAKLGERFFGDSARRYVRRYLRPPPGPLAAATTDQPFDAVMELWFDDEASCLAALARVGDPETQQIIIDDEAHLFDRAANRVFMVEEHESALSPG